MLNAIIAAWHRLRSIVLRANLDRDLDDEITSWLLGVFAGVALLLAAIGIYGVMSYLVLQRTREVGIRMALGATRDQIVRLVVGGGAALIVLGVALGGVAALVLERFAQSLFYEVSVRDAATAVAIGLLMLVGLAACYLPAVRAARTDPLVALRGE